LGRISLEKASVGVTEYLDPWQPRIFYVPELVRKGGILLLIVVVFSFVQGLLHWLFEKKENFSRERMKFYISSKIASLFGLYLIGTLLVYLIYS